MAASADSELRRGRALRTRRTTCMRPAFPSSASRSCLATRTFRVTRGYIHARNDTRAALVAAA